nr:MATE family efflux transporter [Bowmanella yangjiangensis]
MQPLLRGNVNTRAQQQGLWGLSKPLLLEQALQFSVPLMDTLFLAILSDAAASAAGALAPVLFLCGNIIWVTVFAGASIANQRLGAGNLERAKATIWIYALWSILLGILIALGLYVATPWITSVMGLNGDIGANANDYLHIAATLVIVWAVKGVCHSILNMHGLPGWNLLANLVYFLANLAGNAIVVYQLFGLPHYGITGVAWASVIASSLGVLVSLTAITFNVPLKITLSQFTQNFSNVTQNLLRIAAPSAIEPLSFDINMVVLNSMAAKLGALALAAKVYTFNTFMLGLIISVALTTATQILVTQKVGAGKLQQADQQLRRSLRIALLGTGLTAALLVTLNQSIMQLYTQDEWILAGAFWWFLLAGLSEPGRTVNIMTGLNLRATGDGWYISAVGLLFTWLVALPLAYLLAFVLKLGLLGLLISAVVDESGRALLFYRRWRQQRWHHSHIHAREARL